MTDLGTIFTLREAAAFCTLSLTSFEKLRRAGDGPIAVEISERLIGFAKSDLNDWLWARRRAGPRAARVVEATAA